MKNEYLVSVIIPSYNRKETVKFTIDSILNQQCNFDFEIVIGDDFSTDGVRDVLLAYQRDYPDKIKLLFHDNNIGLGANWATCVKQSKGKHIANCDNDDYWHNPKKLQLQVETMEANPEYGLCHTDYINHNRSTGVKEEVACANSIKKDTPLLTSIMKGYFRCCNATVMYKRDVLLKYVNLDDYIKHQFTLQDWNTWMLLAKYTKFYELHTSTATFGIETESITRPDTVEKLEKRFAKERKVYKYVCEQLPEDFQYREEDYTIYENQVLLNLAVKLNDYTNAKKIAQKIDKLSLKKVISGVSHNLCK